MCENNSFVSDYLKTWNDFGSSLKEFKTNVENYINANDSLNIHKILTNIYDRPKIEMINYLKDTQSNQKSSPNPGSFTGIFFENILGIFIEPYIKKRVNPVQIERNCCDDNTIRSKIQRDPDFYLKSNNNRIIIEVKVAPNKNDLDSIINLRKKCISQDLGFYFIGGWVTASTEQLELFIDKRWACFLDGSKRNKEKVLPKLSSVDEVFQNIYKELA